MRSVVTKPAVKTAVIVRLDPTIQYAVTSELEPGRLESMDTRLRGYNQIRGINV
jgi:hypothetical protein